MPKEILLAKAENGELDARSSQQVVPWWSFGKVVLAAAALALTREGKISLDSKIEERPFTLRQLLQHTSGLRDYGTLDEYHAAVAADEEPWTVAEVCRRTNTEALLFEPGAGFSYSNIGYLFVRQIIERATASNLGRALQTLVFAPLGVQGVGVEEGRLNDSYNAGWVYPGLIVGPLTSAVQTLDSLFRSDFLPPVLKDEMRRPYAVADSIPGRPAKKASYGLGVMIGETEKGLYIGHTGQGPGSSIAVYHFPSRAETLAAYTMEGNAEAQGALEQKIIELA